MALGATGCGGGSKASDAPPTAGETTTTTSSAGGSPDPSVTSGRKKGGTDSAASAAKATTTTTPGRESLPPGTPPWPETAENLAKPGPKGQLELVVTLKESCVKPGGTQSITITTTPGSAVGYDSVYWDGKRGGMEGHYGGNSGGKVDDSGTWKDTWVIAPGAPVGQVQVNALGAHLDYGFGQSTLYFRVVDVLEACD